MKNAVKITRARENNLKEISVEIPHDELTVVTGLSGSGKSSLAFDTVYAEGQRCYLETFSSYTRQFFDLVKKPDVDLIEHVRPAIAIEQRTRIKSSRSTVGSVSGVNDYLKVVWNYLAEPVCASCKTAIEVFTPKSAAIRIEKNLEAFPDSIFVICAPITVGAPKKRDGKKAKGEGTEAIKATLERLKLLGFSRIFDAAKSEFIDLDRLSEAAASKFGELNVVIERVKFGSHGVDGIATAVDRAYGLSAGRCVVIESGTPRRRAVLRVINSPEQPNIAASTNRILEFRQNPGCEYSKISIKGKRPSLFSFNHPYGACEKCKGFGSILEVDKDKCIPDKRKSIEDGALQCWSGDSAASQVRKLIEFCEENNIATDKPWQDLSSESQELIFQNNTASYRGVFPWFKRLERKLYKTHVRVFLARYRKEIPCPECKGFRLNDSALAYEVAGLTIADTWQMPLSDLSEWIDCLAIDPEALPRQVKTVFEALRARIRYLIEVGLPYLTLNRQSNTLSGGETQRVNLAAAIGSNLISTQFVLDEPTVGLHARDTARLIKTIGELKSRGNSVLVVEHDTEVMESADNIIEIGPGAGSKGGTVVYSGKRENWSGITEPKWPKSRGILKGGPVISIREATARNLKRLNLDIPLNSLVTISGVSGSGKSTLLHEVIVGAAEAAKLGEKIPSAKSVTGLDYFDDVILVDQSPISKTPRGNLATYSDIWTTVRKLLAETSDARLRRLSASSFSFNVDAGRCTACKGAGFIREDMQFLSDVYIPCETCLGKRFEQKVLEVQYKGKSVADLLDITVAEASDLFRDVSAISNVTQKLTDLGLSYLRLGHSLSELSGGEAQRLKLISHIGSSTATRCLFLFDEPTTGLHLHDVARLVTLFRRLLEEGHSIICVEHNLNLINASDWIIDMGPEGGEGGGRILFEGTPEKLAHQAETSHTAKFLNLINSKSKSSYTEKVIPIHKNAPVESSRKNSIEIKGAREHNLKNVDLSVPLNKLVVFTGVSGSGKSSIAKDIIYAEGQRSYLDCLSPYARQFIKELKQPDIDSLTGVPPTVCVYQHTFQPGTHSTVGTLTEVYNFLRLLYSKIGIQHCPDHPSEVISPLSPADIASEICSRKGQVKILSPIIKGKKGFHKDIIERALELELSHIRVDGKLGNPSFWRDGLERNKAHTIEFVIASFNPKTANKDLVEEAVTQALSLGAGTLIILSDSNEEILSTSRTCPVCRRGFLKPDPEDLSFSSRRGRCEGCDGIGEIEGTTCPDCGGARISEIGRNLRISGLSIHELCTKPLEETVKVLKALNLSKRERALSELLLAEVNRRIELLVKFGVGYLPAARSCRTVSGGELQRLRLAAALGAPLSGVMYILDEPSAGLHPLDNRKVLETLTHLKEEGNSLLVIEHDPSTILSADWVIDVGPGGGSKGGNIVYEGPIKKFLQSKDSETAKALKEVTEERKPVHTETKSSSSKIQITGSLNTVRNLDLSIPMNQLIGIIGVSGAGKSTLVERMIAHTIIDGDKKGNTWSRNGIKVTASSPISALFFVDQKPVGKTSRSVPASYLGVWDQIRKVLALTSEAKARGWKESFFSFNSGKGRCPECKGLGEIVLEMSFLPSARVPCERCRGKRFIDEALTVQFNNLTVSDVLQLTIDEAKVAFAAHRKINHLLNTASDLGLGYLTLGQSTATLSGGEAQRLKLTLELAKPRREPSLYILDEPTAGLHMSDVSRLVVALHGLVAHGHTVIVIEHDEQIIKNCHHLIELGPGADKLGGNVIFQGSFADLSKKKTPWGGIISNTERTFSLSLPL